MNRTRNIVLLLVTFLVCITLIGCQLGEIFSGTKATNPGLFQIKYSILNQQESATLTLRAGDALQVVTNNKVGSVDITIGIQGAKPLYEGQHLTNTSFTLNIAEGGEYQVVVIGHRAFGGLSVIKTVPEAVGNQATEEEKATIYTAYRRVLEQIAYEHTYPDGESTGFDTTSGNMETNHFALYDINGDGTKELIVQFVTAPLGEGKETVYTYDRATDAVKKLLTVSPGATYYTSGMVKEKWFFGAPLSGEKYWPYNLYRYNEQAGKYDLFAEVSMWSKEVDIVDQKGDPYPEEIDVEKAGTVFILTRDGTTQTTSKSDYESWLSGVLEDDDEISLSYQALSRGNILSYLGLGE